jgi:hypothetical protein
MKKLLPLFILSLLYVSVSAQSGQTPTATPVSPQVRDNLHPDTGNHVFYCCRICDYTATTPRSCPVHQLPLIKAGAWYCPNDGQSYDIKGICPNDHKPLVKMDLKYKTVTPKPSDMNKPEPAKK